MGKRKAKEKPGDIEEKGDAEEVEAVLTTPRSGRKAKKQKTPGPGRPSKLSTPVKTMSPGLCDFPTHVGHGLDLWENIDFFGFFMISYT